LASSFDYARQARLYVHRLEPPERGQLSEEYINELAHRIVRVVERTEGGALVLFTNARVLEEGSSAGARAAWGTQNCALPRGGAAGAAARAV
jgi:Rad3-related DNA helicase